MNSSDPAASQDAPREAALLQAAAQLTGAARVTFLDGVCQGDSALRRRLEAALAAREAGKSDGGRGEAGPASGTATTMKLEFAEHAADDAVGQTLGHYRLLERIGEGGCGVV